MRRIKKNAIKKKKMIALMLLCFIISGIFSFMLCVFLFPNIEIENKKIVLEVGEHFQEPEYKAMAKNKDITNLVHKNSNVNEKKIGTYEIDYEVKYSIFSNKKKVIVKVVDSEKPTIELTGGSQVTICPNKEYEELGFKASDNYDGDVTNQVSITENENSILYEVEDSSHNKESITRTITKEDKESPVIMLKGSEIITVYVGDNYQDPGYTATDNCDGDLTDKVEVIGKPNTSVADNYTITYKVKDIHENEVSKVRTIKVITRSAIRPSGGGNGKGILYLTFDDGPNEGTTNVILDILKEEGVQATFFVTCYGPDYLIKRMYNEGHTVALHTATHNYNYVYANETNYFNDLARVSDRVERITGQKSMIIRFPGGSSNTVSKRLNSGIMTRLTKAVKDRGYHYFDWNVDSNDAAGANTNGVYSNVINSISLNRENVVLMHDVKATTRDAIRSIIRYAKANGFTFKKITYDTVMVTHGVNN